MTTGTDSRTVPERGNYERKRSYINPGRCSLQLSQHKCSKEKTSAEEAKTTTTAEDTGVIYEHSTAAKTSSTKKTYTPDTNLVNKLKADAENRASQLRSLVEQMMGKQANTYGNANDIWSFLRSGNFTVDPATKAQAQADIAEDGYWGVNQTSDRIIQFANALTGGDPDKIESMREAFKKGYAQAEKTWGGSLPRSPRRLMMLLWRNSTSWQQMPD